MNDRTPPDVLAGEGTRAAQETRAPTGAVKGVPGRRASGHRRGTDNQKETVHE